jgi:hypothetical protein
LLLSSNLRISQWRKHQLPSYLQHPRLDLIHNSLVRVAMHWECVKLTTLDKPAIDCFDIRIMAFHHIREHRVCTAGFFAYSPVIHFVTTSREMPPGRSCRIIN